MTREIISAGGATILYIVDREVVFTGPRDESVDNDPELVSSSEYVVVYTGPPEYGDGHYGIGTYQVNKRV